jgi:hypothetical protein
MVKRVLHYAFNLGAQRPRWTCGYVGVTRLQMIHTGTMNLLLLALVPACLALNPVIGRALADQFGPGHAVCCAPGTLSRETLSSFIKQCDQAPTGAKS